MKTTNNFIDYGLYIDHERSFIIALSHLVHEQVLQEDTITNDGPLTSNNLNEEHIQRHRNEQLKKFCKAIVEKLEHAHHILIFGPSTAKFELQKELLSNKPLKHISEELLVTDHMEKEAALRFVTDHYTPITIQEEIFTVPKK
jgi:stalled ribosome rescue protein Dom34